MDGANNIKTIKIKRFHYHYPDQQPYRPVGAIFMPAVLRNQSRYTRNRDVQEIFNPFGLEEMTGKQEDMIGGYDGWVSIKFVAVVAQTGAGYDRGRNATFSTSLSEYIAL